MISIPKPCHQNWNEMNPAEKGRFCNACEKVVIDFTEMETSRIIQYLASGQRTCGQLQNYQLWHLNNYIVIKPPIPKKRWKPTGYSLLMAATAFLSACKQSTEVTTGVVILNTEISIASESDPIQDDSIKAKDESQLYWDWTTTGDITTSSDVSGTYSMTIRDSLGEFIIEDSTNFPVTPDNILVTPEILPEYIYGEAALMSYIKNNTVYPPCAFEQGIEGRVYIAFIVKANGSVADIKVVRDPAPGSGLAEEALRVIQNMAGWKPGQLNGKPIDTNMTIPISFKLE